LFQLPFPWLKSDWESLAARLVRLPHALLLTGPEGIGKRALAQTLAQALVCENPGRQALPCGECPACRWFADGNHPDFRAILPEILQGAGESDGEAEGDEFADAGPARSRAGPSKVIKIAQVRALDDFLAIGTHRAGRRVVLIYPADAMTVDAANAVLKMLEEPPPATYFLLVTARPADLLPTIRSRTSRIVVRRPQVADACAWLAGQGIARPEQALADAGGAPLLAAEADPDAGLRDMLLDALATGRPFDPVSLAEKCEKAGSLKITTWLSRWIADLEFARAGVSVRYHPSRSNAVVALAARMPAPGFLEFYRRLMRQRRVAEHPLNARLYTEDLLIDYARLVPR
jgi:DNA polymerase-3 subunit delta'